MSMSPPYVEFSPTRYRTTLDLLVSCIPHITALGIASSSLRNKRDMKISRPYTLPVRGISLLSIAVNYYALTRKLAAIERRHWHGMKLLDRGSSEDPTMQNVIEAALTPVNAASALYQIRSGKTLLFGKELTKLGKQQMKVKLAYVTFSGITASIELYNTRDKWLRPAQTRHHRRYTPRHSKKLALPLDSPLSPKGH